MQQLPFLNYPLARNQYINNSPGIFSCIRAGANTGAACIRTERILLKFCQNTREILAQNYFPVFPRVRIQAPHVFAQKLIPQEIFPACIGFVPGGILCNSFWPELCVLKDCPWGQFLKRRLLQKSEGTFQNKFQVNSECTKIAHRHSLAIFTADEGIAGNSAVRIIFTRFHRRENRGLLAIFSSLRRSRILGPRKVARFSWGR